MVAVSSASFIICAFPPVAAKPLLAKKKKNADSFATLRMNECGYHTHLGAPRSLVCSFSYSFFFRLCISVIIKKETLNTVGLALRFARPENLSSIITCVSAWRFKIVSIRQIFRNYQAVSPSAIHKRTKQKY